VVLLSGCRRRMMQMMGRMEKMERILMNLCSLILKKISSSIWRSSKKRWKKIAMF